DAAHAELDVDQLAEQGLAGRDDGPHLLRGQGLAVHRPIPSHAKSCAMPRASRRSVFTVIADNAAFTCRVSSRTTSKPACVKAACSHCDKGPASSPMRTTLISREEK